MRLVTMAVATSFAFLIFSAGAEEPPAKTGNEEVEKERAAEALKLCLRAAKEYRLLLSGPEPIELELKTHPLLRWSNPSYGSIHGVVYVWTHEGRPAAIASIYKIFDPPIYMHFEVHSLSEVPLLGMFDDRPIWNSSRPGVDLKPLTEAPTPAANPAGRLTQMRTVSKDFTVEKTDRDNGSQQQMRLLTQPIFRYQSQSAKIIDGAIFAFVQGTDPEVLLMLEVREGATGPEWQYALARMNSVVFRVRYKDREVWKTDVLPWSEVFDGKSPYNLLKLDHLAPSAK